MIPVTVVGSYPRVGDQSPEQRLRRAIEHLDQGEITRTQLAETEDEVTRQIIEEQIELGVDLPSDGEIRWDDSVSYMMRPLKGCVINGLVRYFDTNTYYRQPIVQEKLRYEQPILVRDYEFAQKVAGKKPIKVILTGPYSLAKLSKDEFYKDVRKLSWELAGILNQELVALTKRGAQFFQIDEPAILSNPEDRVFWYKVLDMLTHGVSATSISLFLNYGRADGVWNDLLQLAVDELALDLTIAHPHLALLSKQRVTKRICAGVVDARNTLMEKREKLAAHIQRLQEILGMSLVSLSPNYSLEFLPRDAARAKLKLLAKVAHQGDGKWKVESGKWKEKTNEKRTTRAKVKAGSRG